MRNNFCFSCLLGSVVFAVGCKPKVSDSEETATSREGGQSQRCNQILPSVEKVAIATLGKMVEYAKSDGKNSTALAVSKGTVRMLENMMRSTTNPIHPVAFYAAVKDFESAADLSWASKGASGLRYFRTGNCTSGECLGLFQVDVKIESAWRGGEFCQSGGLNLWSTTKGGPDFCAAQFWWILAEGGKKCAKLTRNGANPCKDAGYTWTLNDVEQGRWAYVQQPQPDWGPRGWRYMYSEYEKCYTTKKPLLTAINDFKIAVGLISAPPSSSTTAGPESISSFTNYGSAFSNAAPLVEVNGPLVNPNVKF